MCCIITNAPVKKGINGTRNLTKAPKLALETPTAKANIKANNKEKITNGSLDIILTPLMGPVRQKITNTIIINNVFSNADKIIRGFRASQR